jgi:tetratricopeptide (TPR) repeat protein
VLLVVGVLLVFLPARQNGFINYDDDVYVTENLHVQSGLSGSGVVWAFTSFNAGNWHPLTWLSHMLDCQLFQLRPAGHHLTSVLFHVATTLLLFVLLRRITGATWRSFFVAALFGVHPLHVESVVWVAERKDVLSGLFFVLTVWCYASYAKASARRATLYYSLTLVCFILGLLSKPMLVTLPFVLLLLDIWPLLRWRLFDAGENRAQLIPLKRLLLEKLPFLMLAVVASVITWLAQRQGGAISRLPLPARIENALVAYVRYLAKMLWPSNLSVFYPVPAQLPLLAAVAACLLLLGITALLWSIRRARPYALIGWLWFLGTLVPVIGLVQVGSQSMADRYTYLPSVGLFVIVVWGLTELVTICWPAGQRILVVVGICVLIASATATERQIGYWRDNGTLFQHALDVTKRDAVAELHLGSFQLQNLTNTDEAIQHLEAAIEIEPRLAESYDALGTALYRKGQRQEALRQFQQAVALKPDYAVAHFNLAVVLQSEGRLDDALKEFEQALALKPDYAEACGAIGVVLASQGKTDAALTRFQQAVALNPNLAVVHYNFGLALLNAGRRDEASLHFSRALALRPNYPDARRQLEKLKQ